MTGGRQDMKKTFLFIAAVIICAGNLQAASWTAFQKGPARTGNALEYAYPKLSPLWSFDVQGEFVAPPSVYDGAVFAGARDGSVWAWRVSDGETLWQYSTAGWVDSSPCVWKNRVIALSRDGVVYCFDRATGDIAWTLATGNANVSSPVVYKDVLYFMSGSPGTDVVAVDPADGTVKDRITLSQYGFSSPALDGNMLAVGTNDGRINVINLDTKQVNVLATRGGIKYITPAIKNSRIYVSTDGDERRIYALDFAGNVLWRTPRLSDKPMSASSISVGEDAGYVAVSSGSEKMLLIKFSLSDGATQWSRDIGNPSPIGNLAAPTLAGDLIYVVSGDGYLRTITSGGLFVEPFSGNEVASSTGVWLGGGVTASVTVVGGKIFAGTNAGTFWVFECEKIVSINYPDEYDVVVNSVTVSAVIKDEATNTYLLEYKKDTADGWSSISSGVVTSAENINVAQWNTGGLSDGSYSIMLTANASSARRALARFTVNNSPPPPTNLVAADAPFDGGGSIVLNWNKSADDGAGDNDVAGYRIYRSTYSGGGFSEIKTAPAGAVSAVDSSLLNQTTYFYRLKAFDSLSDSVEFSNTASAFAVVDGVLVAHGAASKVTLILSDGTTVEALIPESALRESVYIGIRVPTAIPDGGVPASAIKTSRIYEFGATKLNGEKLERFLAPVTIKLPYSLTDISGMKEENLRLYRYSYEKSLWQAVNTSFVEPSLRKVGASVPSFSLYGIMEYVIGAEELISFDKTYAYPNPARGGKARFKYYLGDKADVTVEIYNVAGELVAVLERRDSPAGIASEIEWDVSRVASGVYIWRIEARSASGVKSLKKKLAVIN